MNCFARLVRLLLGDSAIAERKLECGEELEVLGVIVSPIAANKPSTSVNPELEGGVRFRLSTEKAEKV